MKNENEEKGIKYLSMYINLVQLFCLCFFFFGKNPPFLSNIWIHFLRYRRDMMEPLSIYMYYTSSFFCYCIKNHCQIQIAKQWVCLSFVWVHLERIGPLQHSEKKNEKISFIFFSIFIFFSFRILIYLTYTVQYIVYNLGGYTISGWLGPSVL